MQNCNLHVRRLQSIRGHKSSLEPPCSPVQSKLFIHLISGPPIYSRILNGLQYQWRRLSTVACSYPILWILFAASLQAQSWSRTGDVFTDATPREAARLARRLAELRAVFPLEAPIPTRVVALRKAEDFEDLRPSSATAGFYQSAPEVDWIVLQAGSPAAPRILAHEYVHRVLHHTVHHLPVWLEEGTAEFYSTLDVSPRGVFVGPPPPNHRELLSNLRWIPLERLFAITKSDREFNDPGLFYAQSWAVVHWLELGRACRAPFQDALLAGRPFAAALDSACAVTPAQLEQELRLYLARPALPTRRLPVLTIPPLPAPLPITPLEAFELRADLAQACGRDEIASQLRSGALTQETRPAEQASLRGLLALRDNNRPAALAHFERAFSLGARRADLRFEYAILLRDSGAPRARVIEQLRETVAANPSYAEAHYLLGTLLEPAAALPHLEAATRILPRQSPFWYARALAEQQLGHLGPSRESARKARETAERPQDRALAESLTSRESPAPPAAPKPPVSLGPAWQNPRGELSLVGDLVAFDCAEPPRLRLQHAAGVESLTVADPSKVEIRGAAASRFEFRCGPQSPPLRVRVEFTPARVLTALELLSPLR